jgi:multidrug resistance efflux pump
MKIPTAAVALGLLSIAVPALVAAGPGETPGDDEPSLTQLDGTLVPIEAADISLWLDRYRGELLVLEAVPPGTFVNDGDVLIRFDTTAIDEQIRQADFDLHQARRKLEQTEQETQIAEEAAEAGLASAEKTADWAARKLAAYLEREKAFTLEEIRLREQSTQHRLDDQRDELEQLERMYEEDELVDATEEIVLKRSRRDLASSLARAKLNEQRDEHRLAHTEVIRQEGLEQEAALKQAALDRERRSAAIKREARQAALDRARFDLGKKLADLDGLNRDREKLIVRAPRGGMVLHGDAEAAPGSATVQRGDRVSQHKTIMLVADPDRLKAVTDVDEALIFEAKSGSAVEVTLAAAPEFKALGTLEVSYLPTGRRGGENVYRAEVALESRDRRLRPGMQCRVGIFTERRHDADVAARDIKTRRAAPDEPQPQAEPAVRWEAEPEAQGAEPSAGVMPGEPVDDGVSGTWTGTITGGDLPPGFAFVMVLQLDGRRVTGAITVAIGSGEVEGTYDRALGTLEATISAMTEEGELLVSLTAAISGASLSGTLDVDGEILEISGSRTEVAS